MKRGMIAGGKARPTPLGDYLDVVEYRTIEGGQSLDFSEAYGPRFLDAMAASLRLSPVRPAKGHSAAVSELAQLWSGSPEDKKRWVIEQLRQANPEKRKEVAGTLLNLASFCQEMKRQRPGHPLLFELDAEAVRWVVGDGWQTMITVLESLPANVLSQILDEFLRIMSHVLNGDRGVLRQHRDVITAAVWGVQGRIWADPGKRVDWICPINEPIVALVEYRNRWQDVGQETLRQLFDSGLWSAFKIKVPPEIAVVIGVGDSCSDGETLFRHHMGHFWEVLWDYTSSRPLNSMLVDGSTGKLPKSLWLAVRHDVMDRVRSARTVKRAGKKPKGGTRTRVLPLEVEVLSQGLGAKADPKLEQVEAKIVVEQIMSNPKLTDREKQYLGIMVGDPDLEDSEIAKKLHVSSPRVCQIKDSIRRKLRLECPDLLAE